ncbi:hypothetical protein [Parachlamydia sp. AcF125]|uniref:hypothetical protein n=1 Tax=Parachlamydia sp. AcF125 TaxID=2795736 RepID=UPI001BC94477|nr:hypothetical protein [Parachlamydia sp. AcF125]MBS4168589.1 hypothetical protein [Parachlamydia sp. AcF125]
METNLNSPAGGDAFRQFYDQSYPFPPSEEEQLGSSSKAEDAPIPEEKKADPSVLKKQLQIKSLGNSKTVNDLFVSRLSAKAYKEHTKRERAFEEEVTQKKRQEKSLRQARKAKKEAWIERMKKAHQQKDQDSFIKRLDKIRQVDLNRINPQA